MNHEENRCVDRNADGRSCSSSGRMKPRCQAWPEVEVFAQRNKRSHPRTHVRQRALRFLSAAFTVRDREARAVRQRSAQSQKLPYAPIDLEIDAEGARFRSRRIDDRRREGAREGPHGVAIQLKANEVVDEQPRHSLPIVSVSMSVFCDRSTSLRVGTLRCFICERDRRKADDEQAYARFLHASLSSCEPIQQVREDEEHVMYGRYSDLMTFAKVAGLPACACLFGECVAATGVAGDAASIGGA